MRSVFVSVKFFLSWHIINVKLESDTALKMITLKEIRSSVEQCYFAGSLSYASWVLGIFHLLKMIVTSSFSTKLCLFSAANNTTSLQFDQPLKLVFKYFLILQVLLNTAFT